MSRIQRQICAYCDEDLPAKPAGPGAPEIKYVVEGCPCVKP